MDKSVDLENQLSPIFANTKPFNVKPVMVHSKVIQMIIPFKQHPSPLRLALGVTTMPTVPTLISNRIYNRLLAKVDRLVVEKLFNGISFDQLLRLILTGGANVVSMMMNNAVA